MKFKFLKEKKTYYFLQKPGFYLGLIIIIIIGSLVQFFPQIGNFLFPKEVQITTSKNLETLKFTIYLIGGLLFIWQIYLTNRRTKASEKTAETMFQSQIQERFKNAIDQLGSEKETVNFGAIYTLHHVAKDSQELRKSVFDILCSYIRETTTNKEYQERKNTSIKIQSVLNLLFVYEVEKLIYDYIADLHSANLLGAYLSNANLLGAYLSRANLSKANLTGANLFNANLTDTNLYKANLTGANLTGADLTNSSIYEIIVNQDWIEKLKIWNCKGLEDFESNYKVIEKEDINKEKIWVVVKKNSPKHFKENN